MKGFFWLGTILFGMSLGLLGGTATLAEEELPERAKAAAEALMPFKKNLKAALLQSLEKGPAEAIRSCNSEAPKIRDSLAQDGIQLGRTSHRLRNPNNAPQDWMKSFLEGYQQKKDGQPRWAEFPDGSFGYVEPIYVQPLCLTCHGENLPLEVTEQLRSLYPKDQAVGFQEGDFRGLFWVILKGKTQ